MLQSELVAVVTDASGNATVYSEQGFTGAVVMIGYEKTDFADGVDFTITGKDSGVVLWTESNVNASKVMSPSQAVHLNTSGAAQSGMAQQVFVFKEKIKIAIAQGGNSKSGNFRIQVVD